MNAPRPTRVAILGTGGIAQVVHLPILTRMRGVEVVGLCDVDRSKASTIANRFGVTRVYPTADDIWSDDSVDAVIVCTPSNAHEEQALAGLEAGKYVFCEKPLALTEKGARRVVERDGGKGRLMVGMNQRFRPDAAALKTYLTAREFGEVQYVRAGWLNRRLARSPRSWRLHKAGAGGGALMDLGTQMLDLALWLIDYPEPARVVAYLHKMPQSDVEDTAVLLLELVDGPVVNLEATWSLVADRERQYIQVIASLGSGAFPPLKVFRDTENGMLDVSPQLAQSRENQFTASYRQELAHFLEGVRSERVIEPPHEHVTLMKIVEAAYRSAERSTEIRF